jgi:hypothetical protein
VALAAAVLAAIAAWNLAIAWDYVDRGRTEGEPIGSTGRYMASHPRQEFYLVSDEEGPYRYFLRVGNQYWWRWWLSQFSPGVGLRDTVGTYELRSFHPQPPFSLLMSREFLNVAEPELAVRYPHGRVRNVMPTGQLVVFEVPGAETQSAAR